MATSDASVASLQRMSAQTLVEKLRSEGGATAEGRSFAVVDVRDDDHIGGHIRGSLSVPSQQLSARAPTLIRQLDGKRAVIFHCALSQQRGPSAALWYLRNRDELAKTAGLDAEKQPQQVYILDGGFTRWQEAYGEDERLTEGFRKELWRD